MGLHNTGLTILDMRHAELLAQGLSHQEIADVRGVSLNTVKTMIKRLHVKVGTHSALQLVMELQRRKLLVWNRERAALGVSRVMFDSPSKDT